MSNHPIPPTGARSAGTPPGRRRSCRSALYAASMLAGMAPLVPALAQPGTTYAPPGAVPPGPVPVGPSAVQAQPGQAGPGEAGGGQAGPGPTAPAPATAAAPSPAAPTYSGPVPGRTTPAGTNPAGGAAVPTPAPPMAAPGRTGSASRGATRAAPAEPAVPAPQGAAAVLLQQANFWHNQYQDGRALEAVNKILALEPDNADALALGGQIHASQGDRAAAQAAIEHLRRMNAGDPRIARIESALRLGAINPQALAEARRFAQEGRNAEAVQRYQQLFRGEAPPDTLAVEYYQALAGTEGGWQQARDGLAAIVRQNPQDLRAQLAYAEVLTYQEGSARADGIARLARLAESPAIGPSATQAWRQALLWLPANASSVPPLNAYLQRHPDDTGIQQALATARHPANTGDVAGDDRAQGFRALNAGRLAQAERLFDSALARNANDSDALGGLGIVRLRQGRAAEARNLLQRAIALDPAKRGQWQAALNGTNRRPGPTTSPTSLADSQARRGDLAGAEASYRAVLERQANNANALVGLAGVLQQEGHTAEARDMLARAAATGSRVAGQARAEQLRLQAAEVTDPGTRIGLYHAALAADPGNPWLHLDLARTLAAQGQMAEARAVMAEVTGGRRVSADALRAGIIFANEANLPEEANALIARVPPRQRTGDMMASMAQARVQRDIQAAAALPPEIARQRLLALAAAPDPDGNRGAAIARALTRLGDRAGARAAILTARASSGYQNANARVAYAGALMEAGYSQDAQAMLSQLGPATPLTPQQRQAVNDMRAGLAVRASDRLNREGRQAAAYDQLAPELRQNPGRPDLDLALGRLYQGADRPGRALAIAQEVLRRNPNSEQARQAAVQAALAAGDLGVADRLVREGLSMHPNDPQAWITSANLARARGNNGRALQDLERARQLREQQIGSDSGADFSSDPSSNPAMSGGAGLPGAGSTMTLAPNGPPIYGGATRAAYQAGTGPTSLAPADGAPAYAAQGYASPGYGYGYGGGGRPAPVRAQALPPPYRAPPLYPPSPFRNAPPRPPETSPYETPYRSAEGDPLAPSQPYQPPQPAPPPALPGIYGNPFRRNGSAPGAFGATTEQPVVQDPMTVQIERSMAAIRDEVSPAVQGGVSLRARSGQSGLDQLTEAAIPMEASFSPGGFGRLRLLAQPTYLSAGSISADALTQGRFGTQALNVTPPAAGAFAPGLAGPVAKDQHAQGVGLDLAYNYQWLGADIGTTPLGFDVTNVIGGVELTPQLAPGVRLRLTGERRAVTDSLLSYAGTKDPRTNATFGGVTRTRGYAQLELSAGIANFYLGGGYAYLDGQNVVHNREGEAGLGGSIPIYRTPTDEVRVGVDLVYFGFDKNLRYFTLGQGGYFSPQTYFAALLPVNYQSHLSPDLVYSIGASVGLQTYNEDRSLVYPGNAALQAQLESLAAGVPGLTTAYSGKNSTGFTGAIHGAIEYSASPSLKVGARASFEHAGDFNEGQGLVYARYLFNGAQ